MAESLHWSLYWHRWAASEVHPRRDLSQTAKLLAVALAARAGRASGCAVSRVELAAALGVSTRTVTPATAELKGEGAGLIRR